jgi:hypothetical protein
LQRCLRLAAIKLCCLSGRALVGELTLERRAVFPSALFDPVGALAGGLGALLGAGGALLGLVGELVAALGVFCGASGFPLGGASGVPVVTAQLLLEPRLNEHAFADSPLSFVPDSTTDVRTPLHARYTGPGLGFRALGFAPSPRGMA